MNPQDASRKQRLHHRPDPLRDGERPMLQGHLKRGKPSAAQPTKAAAESAPKKASPKDET